MVAPARSIWAVPCTTARAQSGSPASIAHWAWRIGLAHWPGNADKPFKATALNA